MYVVLLFSILITKRKCFIFVGFILSIVAISVVIAYVLVFGLPRYNYIWTFTPSPRSNY